MFQFLASGPATLSPDAMNLTPFGFSSWALVLPVLIPLLSGVLCVFFRHQPKTVRTLAGVGIFTNFAAVIWLFSLVHELGSQSLTMSRWLPPFGISFAADYLSSLLCLGAAFVGILCFLFSLFEISARSIRFNFYAMFMIMIAGVMGAFLTGDIFNLYVWFEVFLISSFGLIALGSEPRQLDGTVKYAILNLLATTFFLVATGYLYGVVGTLNIADISTKLSAQSLAGAMYPIAGLYLLAFGMKAAAFPGYFWLPASYHTPKFVVSALFAGMLTKVGVYALWRTSFTMLPGIPVSSLMGYFYWGGMITMFIGAVGVVSQSDIRRLLGYVLISGIGLIMLGTSLKSLEALSLVIFYALHSMIAMTGLYCVSALMVQATKSFSIKYVSGLYTQAPFLTVLFFILGFGVAGLPPFSGVWPKVGLIQLMLEHEKPLAVAMILFNGFLTLIAIGRVFGFSFWRKQVRQPSHDPLNCVQVRQPLHLAHSRDLAFTYIAPLIAAALVFGFGLFPQLLYDVSQNAAASILDTSSYAKAVLGNMKGTVMP